MSNIGSLMGKSKVELVTLVTGMSPLVTGHFWVEKRSLPSLSPGMSPFM